MIFRAGNEGPAVTHTVPSSRSESCLHSIFKCLGVAGRNSDFFPDKGKSAILGPAEGINRGSVDSGHPIYLQ